MPDKHDSIPIKESAGQETLPYDTIKVIFDKRKNDFLYEIA